ncbi:hypothetical protein R1flu_003140 [Riccia fluitans]|uniref:Uncharacterized protein n=1 Tax=Riccia fluitans TaxID=41844 RepID=A0ABD1Y860_9MARC
MEPLPGGTPFPVDFSSFVPNMGKFGIDDIRRIMNEAGETGCPYYDYEPQVVCGGGTWFMERLESGYSDIFALRAYRPTVSKLPKLYEYWVIRLGIFAATFKALV